MMYAISSYIGPRYNGTLLYLVWTNVGTKLLHGPILAYENLNQNIEIFVQQNAFKNVACKIVAILYLSPGVITVLNHLWTVDIPRRLIDV